MFRSPMYIAQYTEHTGLRYLEVGFLVDLFAVPEENTNLTKSHANRLARFAHDHALIIANCY